MNRITIIAPGKLSNPSLRTLCGDYIKRISRKVNFELLELKDGSVEELGKRILKALDVRKGRVYTLACEGKRLNSEAFAKLLRPEAAPIRFVLGGPYGLSEAVQARANGSLSFSPMTFPHELARSILLEQIYRGLSILEGLPYHHA